MIDPTIHTSRLTLRGLTPADFPPLADLYASPRSAYIDGPQPAHQVWLGFASDVGQWVLKGYGTWAVDRTATGAHIGLVALNHPHEYPEPELGWLLYDGYEGHGYAHQAALAARAYAFDWLGMPTLVSYVSPENHRSRRQAERLGAQIDPDAATPLNEPCLTYRHRRGG